MYLWRGLIQNIKDCLFPIFCLECQSEGDWWCKNCLKKYFEVGVFCCPVCHAANSNGQPCNQCKTATPLNGVAAFFDYNERSVVGQLIKQFKYNFAYDIELVWQNMADLFLLNVLGKMEINVSSILIIPVPLHISRERERGFNQAELIAKSLYKKISTIKQVDMDSQSLCRIKRTKQQAKLNRVNRQENLKDAFVWRGKNSVSKNILLIDDVYTSGATMQECAKVLKQNGAQKVYGLTLARD